MIRRRITTSGTSAILVLPPDVMELMGVEVGDEVDLELVDRSLLVRPVREVERSARVSAATDRVFREHAGLLRRLAGGVSAESARPTKPERPASRRKKR